MSNDRRRGREIGFSGGPGAVGTGDVMESLPADHRMPPAEDWSRLPGRLVVVSGR